MKKPLQKLTVFAGLLLCLILLFILFSSAGAPIRERFRPKDVTGNLGQAELEFTYLDEEKTMVVYFTDRPRLDYKNFPEKEYEKLLHSEDQTAYYFEHIHEKVKP